MNMEINNEGQGLDPLYDQGLYFDKQAALHLDHNDGVQLHQVGGGNNIDDQLGDVQDGLTLDSLSMRRFTDAEYESRVSSLNKSQRVPYKKIVQYTRAVLDYKMGNRELRPLLLDYTKYMATLNTWLLPVPAPPVMNIIHHRRCWYRQEPCI